MKWIKRKLMEFEYRNQDENVCCCGCTVGTGGDICYHGGCRSMKEYAMAESRRSVWQLIKDAARSL